MNIGGVHLTRDDGAGLTALAALAATAWFVGLGPLLRARAIEQAQAEDIERKRARLEAVEFEVGAEERRREDLAARLALLRSETPPAETLNQFIERFLGIAEHSGFTVDRLAPGNAEPSDAWTDTPIGVEGRCPPSALADFFATLRREAPTAAIERFALDVGSDNTLTVRLGCVWRTARTDDPSDR